MLEALELAVVRGERIIFAGLSFRCGPGEALLLTGPNGAGKSTLLRLLAGLVPPAEGSLLWNGGDALADGPAHSARLRYLAHADALKPGLTLRENLQFWSRLWGGDVGTALEAVGLRGLEHLPARMLSAGQKRRAALARLALAPVPLWLLDEPSVGLDSASIELFGAMLAAHRAAGGAVIAATHVGLPLPGAGELRLTPWTEEDA
ncbi:heme ABC exporter ATP-binding protein CcmA [Roseomonas marmotae]|uniref:Heme ABC exporter ATP-binding protein CcmA n=1 Tax=Roseomonas marmotae TaxID=2768161 RepID=A0ABS3KIA6_9PROT|nr:heme ABC exporter ATP-binding protein CcmA [Roseomonas marmotae]MBO1076353.1 heme ABC exporter ATP-binding protein CcmA [Roseomonas marmotae]QTI80584.1 heme ABC exporter ATP-binding protein CcmA [Roseomonas marmotae]